MLVEFFLIFFEKGRKNANTLDSGIYNDSSYIHDSLGSYRTSLKLVKYSLYGTVWQTIFNRPDLTHKYSATNRGTSLPNSPTEPSESNQPVEPFTEPAHYITGPVIDQQPGSGDTLIF